MTYHSNKDVITMQTTQIVHYKGTPKLNQSALNFKNTFDGLMLDLVYYYRFNRIKSAEAQACIKYIDKKINVLAVQSIVYYNEILHGNLIEVHFVRFWDEVNKNYLEFCQNPKTLINYEVKIKNDNQESDEERILSIKKTRKELLNI